LRQPDFGVLFARIRDRVHTLRQIYGRGPLPLDFSATGERARQVKLVRNNTRWETHERRSGKTGQTHPLAGFAGTAEYQGDLSEFLPYLRAASWTGVGRPHGAKVILKSLFCRRVSRQLTINRYLRRMQSNLWRLMPAGFDGFNLPCLRILAACVATG
jgi:hypothetical protein